MEDNAKKVEVIHARPKEEINEQYGIPAKKLKVAAYCRVSTEEDEQIDSFNSQKKYYTDFITSNSNWTLAGIYADEGISGTKIDKRIGFQRMITDALAGKIDIIYVKSLSRFSRNTLDTLNYIRLLKEKGVNVHFEEERIDTIGPGGELLLTILSSTAQQEVINTSEHVKLGLTMKMKRGELIGNNGCLGYDYDPQTKTIAVNEKEAEIVKYIFKRYIEGAGTTVLAHELEAKGWKTKWGNPKWADTTILGIIKNEKYKGDLLQGKTFTVNPLTGKRLDNRGEANQFLVHAHHEAIIDPETWDKANAILKKRSYVRRLNPDGTRSRFSRQYTLSSLCECGFCGRVLDRRRWNSGRGYDKVIWLCAASAKNGKKRCPNAKGIPDDLIKGAFVEAYNRLVSGGSEFIQDFVSRANKAVLKASIEEEGKANDNAMKANEEKMAKLTDLYLSNMIGKENYEAKYKVLATEKQRLEQKRDTIEFQKASQISDTEKLNKFQKAALSAGAKITNFDPDAFDSCVEKIIVGGFKTEKVPDPYKITFVFKKEFGQAIPMKKRPEKGSKHAILMEFDIQWQHQYFVTVRRYERQKIIDNFVHVVVAVDLD